MEKFFSIYSIGYIISPQKHDCISSEGGYDLIKLKKLFPLYEAEMADSVFPVFGRRLPGTAKYLILDGRNRMILNELFDVNPIRLYLAKNPYDEMSLDLVSQFPQDPLGAHTITYSNKILKDRFNSALRSISDLGNENRTYQEQCRDCELNSLADLRQLLGRID